MRLCRVSDGSRDLEQSDGFFAKKNELVDAEKANFPITVLCAALGVSRSGFYAFGERTESALANRDAVLAVAIGGAYTKSGKRYGSPRVASVRAQSVWRAS